jgi:hypothetical protein
MVNKKVIYGVGVVVILGVAYYTMKKKKGVVDSTIAKIEVEVKAPYAIKDKDDTTGTVFYVVNNKKYLFKNFSKAFTSYNVKQPILVTKKELDAIPTKGVVENDLTITETPA